MSNTKYSFVIEDTNITNEKDIKEKINAYDTKEFLKKIRYRNKISYLMISITFGISSLSDLAVQYFFKDVLLVQPAELSRLMSIAMIPWFLKPFFGLLTDLVPICGYRRKIYIIVCGILDFLCLMTMSLIEESLLVFISLLFLHNTCLSFSTVLGEAIVVELSKISEEDLETSESDQAVMDNKTSNAKNYVSYFFFFKFMGSLFASLFKGILVKQYELKTVFFISSFIPFFFVLSGIILLENPYEKINKSFSKKDIEDDRLLFNSNTNSILKRKKTEQSCPSKFFRFLFQRHILIPIIFTIIFVGTPGYNDAMFYFFTETLKMDSVDIGIVSMFSTLATLAAILIYRFFLKKKSFRCMITCGSIVAFFVSFSAYILVTRYNIKLGIPDFPFIVFSWSFISMLNELIAMPLLSLAAVLSPENLEGTSYSVFMSALNLGSIISSLLGSFFTNMLNITVKDLSNLPDLILIANFISIVPLPFLYLINKSYFDPQTIHIQQNSDSELNKENKQLEIEIEGNKEIPNAKNYNKMLNKN